MIRTTAIFLALLSVACDDDEIVWVNAAMGERYEAMIAADKAADARYR